MPLLNFLFVFAKLLLQFVDSRVNGPHQVVRLVMGHKIVLVLGGNLEVDAGCGFIRQIDDHFDGSQPVVKPRQFFRFRSDFVLRCFAELTVSGGNLDLHQRVPVALSEVALRDEGFARSPLQTGHSSLIWLGRQTGYFYAVWQEFSPVRRVQESRRRQRKATHWYSPTSLPLIWRGR